MGRPEKYNNFAEISEEKFALCLEDKLSPFFHIKKQVLGTHLTGKKMRIDLIITPKDTTDWKNKNIAFGIEIKSPTKLDRLNGQLGFMKQCVDYSYTNFKDYGFIPILAYPDFAIDNTYATEKSLTALRHFLNQFQVGELKETYRGLSIIFAEHHFIWYNGIVGEGKKWTLKRKFGSKN